MSESQSQPSRGGSPPDPPQKISLNSGDQPSNDSSKIRVIVPDALQGEVMSYLNLLSGILTNIEQGEPSRTIITAILPSGYLPRFKQWLLEFSKEQAQIDEETA